MILVGDDVQVFISYMMQNVNEASSRRMRKNKYRKHHVQRKEGKTEQRFEPAASTRFQVKAGRRVWEAQQAEKNNWTPMASSGRILVPIFHIHDIHYCRSIM